MKYPLIACTSALLLACAAVPSFAADTDTATRGPMNFDAMDTDGDGYVSSDEFKAAHDARREARQKAMEERREQFLNMNEEQHYSAMDANKDGKVSHEEFEAFRQQRMEQRAQERQALEQKREEKRKDMQEKYQDKKEQKDSSEAPRPPTGVQ